MDNQQLNTYIMNKKPKKGFGFIYKYTSPSGKSYVGQTVQTLLGRAKTYSGKGYRKCSLFYKAILKYGFENFQVEILDEVPIEELDCAEAFWIEYSNSMRPNGYNLVTDQKSPVTKHTIYQYEKNTGKFIQEFSSISEAVNSLGLSGPGRISSNINGRALSAHGFIWSLEKKDSVEPVFSITDNSSKKIYQYKLNGDFIREFSSITDAAKAVCGERHPIKRVLKGEQHFAYGYIWSLEKMDKVPAIRTGPNGSKPVKQIDIKTNQVLNIYESISSAAKAVGVSYQGIAKCAKGAGKTSGGYKWEYV